MIIRNRIREHIPILICKTCGKRALQNKVIELEDPGLIKDKRKTWAQLIKPSFNVYYDGARLKRNKRIFYSSLLQRCIEKRHRIKVKYLIPIKFHTSYLDVIKKLKGFKEKKAFIRKKKKLIRNETINCASCNERISIYDVCMNCARCSEHCNCKTKRKVKRDSKGESK